MKDNIKPEHYRKGEIDLYEAFSQIFPHNEYRAGMQMIAMRYMFRDKIDRVEDLKKAIYTLERLKEKEIEHEDRYKEISTKDGTVLVKSDDNIKCQKNIDLLKFFLELGFKYLARDKNGELCAHRSAVYKVEEICGWDNNAVEDGVYIRFGNFPEVKWTDDKPTKISDLLDIYLNGGENGK